MRGTKTAFIRTRLEGVLIPFCVTYADVLMNNCYVRKKSTIEFSRIEFSFYRLEDWIVYLLGKPKEVRYCFVLQTVIEITVI